MDANPDERERWMVRWTLAGELGDLLAPGLVWVSVALGGSYRYAFAAAGALFAIQAVRVARRPFPARGAPDDDDEDVPFLPRLRASLATPGLWPWAFATLACTLLDEIVVAFGALYLTDRLEAPVAVRAAILGAGVAGGALGLFAAERWLVRFEPRRLLLAAAAACAACYALWLRAESPVASGALFAATGFFSALHYPLAMAQLYRVLPESSGTVNALMTVVGILEVPMPLVLGLVADGAGLGAAMALLLLQPVAVGGVALVSLHAVSGGAR
jgi:FSR family fosmidomycin resistance protein-like MFS transporter